MNEALSLFFAVCTTNVPFTLGLFFDFSLIAIYVDWTNSRCSHVLSEWKSFECQTIRYNHGVSLMRRAFLNRRESKKFYVALLWRERFDMATQFSFNFFYVDENEKNLKILWFPLKFIFMWVRLEIKNRLRSIILEYFWRATFFSLKSVWTPLTWRIKIKKI